MDTKDAGRMGGKSKSPRKQEAVRANGKKGGRPTKVYRSYWQYLNAGGQLSLKDWEQLPENEKYQ